MTLYGLCLFQCGAVLCVHFVSVIVSLGSMHVKLLSCFTADLTMTFLQVCLHIMLEDP